MFWKYTDMNGGFPRILDLINFKLQNLIDDILSGVVDREVFSPESSKMKKILLLLALALTGCAAQYDGYSSKMAECGYPNAHYTKLHACMCEKVTVSKNADPQDYFAKTNRDLLERMEVYQAKVDKKQLTSKQAVDDLNAYVSISAIQEHQSNQTAGAVTAAFLLGGAAVAACSHGGCGGANYPSDYRGCCSYHGGITNMCAANGNVLCNDGQPSPTCGC